MIPNQPELPARLYKNVLDLHWRRGENALPLAQENSICRLTDQGYVCTGGITQVAKANDVNGHGVDADKVIAGAEVIKLIPACQRSYMAMNRAHDIEDFREYLALTQLYTVRSMMLIVRPNTGITIQCCFVRDPE